MTCTSTDQEEGEIAIKAESGKFHFKCNSLQRTIIMLLFKTKDRIFNVFRVLAELVLLCKCTVNKFIHLL